MVCDRVESVQTDDDGYYRVWWIPWRVLIQRVYTNAASQRIGAFAPGYISMRDIGKLEETFVVQREFINEHGQHAREGVTDYVATMNPKYEHLHDTYKRWALRPGIQNEFWMVKDSASLGERLARFGDDYSMVTGCELKSGDTKALTAILEYFVAQGVDRKATKDLRRSIAYSMYRRPADYMSRPVTGESLNREEAEIQAMMEKL